MAFPFPYSRNCHDCLLLSQYGFVAAAALMEPCRSGRRILERSEPDRLTGALVLFASFLCQTSVRTFSTGWLRYIHCKPVSKAVFGMGPLHPEPSMQAAREIRLWVRGLHWMISGYLSINRWMFIICSQSVSFVFRPWIGLVALPSNCKL